MYDTRGFVSDIPPRPWGGVAPAGEQALAQGPTPTSVGRSLGDRHRRRGLGTYPHVRGEERPSSAMQTSWADLPPRPWGGEDMTCDIAEISGKSYT